MEKEIYVLWCVLRFLLLSFLPSFLPFFFILKPLKIQQIMEKEIYVVWCVLRFNEPHRVNPAFGAGGFAGASRNVLNTQIKRDCGGLESVVG